MFLSFQVQHRGCPSCPHNKMLLGSECVETCPENTLNFLNRECISDESCEQENLEYWKDFKFVTSNGSCKLVKYCNSIEMNMESTFFELSHSRGCQVIQGFVAVQFPSKLCGSFHKMFNVIETLKKIEEIRDYLKITNSPTIKHLGFLPNLRMIKGVNLESGVNSLVFDSDTELGSVRVALQNYTFNNKVFCADSCDNGNLTLEITPKTFGFVVKILNEEFKNFLIDNISITSFLTDLGEYNIQTICGSVPNALT